MVIDMQLEMIPCPKCGTDFPLKRKELGYPVCVNCSTEKMKVGRIVMLGEGDHTCIELDIMDHDTAAALIELENAQRGIKSTGKVEIQDYDTDEDELAQQTKEKVRNVLEDEDEEEEVIEDNESVLKDLSKERPD